MADVAGLHRLESVEERQREFKRLMEKDAPGAVEDETIFDFGRVDPQTYSRSCESLVGQVSIPVGIVGPLKVHYRDYEEDEDGGLVEKEEPLVDPFYIPMGTHEGGLNASLNRGIKAANECGGVHTRLLSSSMTRGSCYVFQTAEHAYLFSRWAKENTRRMKEWLEDPANPFRDAEAKGIPLLSRHARLLEIDTYLVSNACHTVFKYATGDASGQNMTTRNTYMLHSHFVLPRFHQDTGISPSGFFLEANTGGDKKVSHLYHIHGGHGKTVFVSMILSERVLVETLKCSVEDFLKLREVGGEGAALSGMIGVSCNPANVIAAIFAATGQDLACVGTSSMALASSTECPEGVHLSLRLPNLEVGTVGGGTGLPHQSRYLEVMQCKGRGAAGKFAQIVAAAAACLDISTTSAMAAAGSFSFYMAHLERGGMKRAHKPAQVSETLIDQLKKGETR
jgi:hydroxymethylglutaryl-CoA reductase (NADPH)